MGEWLTPIVGQAAYTALQKARAIAYMDQLFETMRKANITAVTREDDAYPNLLKNITDAPPTLYTRGSAVFDDAYPLAIVGARNCTAYGSRIARRFARDFSTAGGTVISGLARGLDSAAHRGSVDAKARTVAVLGSGADIIYPPEHQILADEILSLGGSVVSELPPGSKPMPHHFPLRNRIISGMSAAVLLVEAARRSGAMSTVAHALEQGREVFAAPGQADSPLSESTHALIRDGARLSTSALEIIEDMGWGFAPGSAEASPAPQKMPSVERRLYSLLSGGPSDTDALMEAMRMSAPEMSSLLTVMELRGMIRKLPGNRVENIR
jgi:DNA processing protein